MNVFKTRLLLRSDARSLPLVAMSRLHANSVDADTSAWGGSVDAIPLAGQTAVPDADDEEVSAADVIEKEQLVK